MLITLDDVRAAADTIKGAALRTPLLPAPWAGPDCWIKPESLQPIGAFKIRGAHNAVGSLEDEVRRRGVVTHSSGNHAQALAHAARAYGVRAVVVMPETAPEVKRAATIALGAEVVPVPPAERESRAAALAAEQGLTLVPPYDHPHVIAGQGTVGLEIVEDLPDVDVVLVPIGGGGLASGVATAVKGLRPRAAVIGVEPELAGDAADSFRRGELVTWTDEQRQRTIADGVRTPLSPLTWEHIRTLVDDVITVTEDEIRAATAAVVRGARLVAEPTGALSIAAQLFHCARLPAGRRVAVLSGGNVDPALLAEVLTLT